MKPIQQIKRVAQSKQSLVISLVSTCAALAIAAPAAKYWLFDTKEEMGKAVPYYSNNPRATYYVIMRAHKRNMAGPACLVYHGLLQKNQRDPYLQSAYAFSHFMATGELSREHLVQKTSSLINELRKQQLGASFWRDEAIKAKPNSAVILMETALPMMYGNGSRPEAVNYLRKATRLAPDWADAHYWLGKGLDLLWASKWSYASDKQAESLKQLGREQLAAYNKAEKLDPRLHVECLIGRAYAYQALGQLQLGLKYLDAYIKAEPETGKQPGITHWRQQLIKEVQKQSKGGERHAN